MWWYVLGCFWCASLGFVAGLFVALSSPHTQLVQTPSLDHLSALTPIARN